MRCTHWLSRRVGLLVVGVLFAFASSATPALAQITVGFEIGAVAATGTSVQVKVVLSFPSTDNVAVEYTTQNDTATSPGDYTGTTGTLVYGPNIPWQVITINGINNASAAGKTFKIQLSNPVNATLGWAQTTVTISADGPPVGGGGGGGGPLPGTPTIEFDAKDYTVVEGTLPSGQYTKAILTVKLSAAATTDVTVNYDFNGGTATAGTDYLVPTSKTVTIPAGQTSATFSIDIVADSIVEATETVGLTLSAPMGYMLGLQNTATLSIMDDDSSFWTVAVASSTNAICAGGKNSSIHQATITATLLDSMTGMPLQQAGIAIDFSTTAGTVSPATATTDANGHAVTLLTSSSYASEGAVKFVATVTGQINGNSASTPVEFQPTQLSVSASPGTISVGDLTFLVANLTKNSIGVEAHTLGWRMSKVWDADNNLVYDGSGAAPTGYGSFGSSSTATDNYGYAQAEFRGTAPGTIELLGADIDVILVASGQSPLASAQVAFGKQAPATLANIYNGQKGKMVAAGKEVTLGAFTVFNANDTNADGTLDYKQDVVQEQILGRDEVDLMRLVIQKQAPVDGKKIKVTLISGPIRFWTSEIKQQEIKLVANGTSFELDPKNGPVDIWLEAGNFSLTVRDIEIKVEYNGASLTMKATAVWAIMSGFESGNKTTGDLFKAILDKDGKNTNIWTNMPTPPKDLLENYGYTGLVPLAQNRSVNNMIAMQFTVYPKDVWKEPGVKFDISRQKQSAIWKKNGMVAEKKVDNAPLDTLDEEAANDDPDPKDKQPGDPRQIDESDEPDADGRMYAIDGPGVRSPVADADVLVFRFNAKEFVRVRFDGVVPSLHGVQGSRCSSYFPWHMQHNLVKDAQGFWARSQTEPNVVGAGHIEIGDFK